MVIRTDRGVHTFDAEEVFNESCDQCVAGSEAWANDTKFSHFLECSDLSIALFLRYLEDIFHL